jgi:hypothetical protein
MFGCKCPLGGCPKAGQWLGQKKAWYSERRARQAVFDHILGSPSHADITSDGASAEADMCEVTSWNISKSDELVQQDERTHKASAEELAEWADQAVTYEDQEKREASAKKARPAEADSSRRAKPRQHHGPSSNQTAVSRRARSRSRSPVRGREFAKASHRLEDQIKQQTRNAYVFVKATWSG